MIDVPDEDIVLERRDSYGRFALFTNTDLPQSCPLPWWSVMLDHGGDASAILLRVDENCGPDDAWTARDITRVALARLQAESNRRLSPLTTNSLWHVDRALSRLNDRPGFPPACPLSFHTGIEPSPYPWTSVQRDDTGDHLDLCPDPSGTNEGISAELLLVVLNQLLQDSSRAFPKESLLALANAHIEQALLMETRRAAFMRACTRP